MALEFIEKYISILLPNEKFEIKIDKNKITIFVKKELIGKIIGKQGTLVGALRSIINTNESTPKKNYTIEVLEIISE
jgi:predicted RNA-binding protein YlqC (UPF0109 family)